MAGLCRRDVLVAAGLAAAAQVDAAETPQRVRITLSQASWNSSASVRELATRIRGQIGLRDPSIADLIVLPPAAVDGSPPRDRTLYDRLGKAAAAANVYLAGAATVRTTKAPIAEGFLIAPDGAVLIRAEKIMPDVVSGFGDITAALGRAGDFPVARLPFGNIGILVGEDIFRPGHVRALFFNGAEILINPAAEAADAGFETRRDAMTAIGYVNMMHVAVATSPAPSRTGLWDWQGNVTLSAGDDAVTAVIDIESLRTARQQGTENLADTSRVLPPMVRDALYGPVFKAAARTIESIPSSATEWAAEAARRIAAQARRATPDETLLPVYDAILMQTPHRVISNLPDRKAAIAQNIRDFLAMAEPHARRPLSKLVMFGEFAFTAAGYRTIPDALSVTLSWPGPELEQIAAFADKHKVYVAAQQLEHDAKFPGRIFNTAFLFDDSGRLAARHRKLQCVDLMGTLPGTTPGSVLDAYVQTYGADGLWSVVDTPLGKLAPTICFENMYPEVAAIYAQKGAEVFLHLTSEGWDPITETRYAWNAQRRLHALQYGAYYLSVNEGDDPVLRDPYHVVGESQAIDPYGRVIGMLRESRPGVLVARIDLTLLKAARADMRANLGIWDEPGVYADAYLQGHAVPNNIWSEVPASVFPYRDLAVYRQVVARFNERGVFTPPRARISPKS